MVSLILKIAMMIASPTATSAAATIITINTYICPSILPNTLEKAMKARLTAFNINSMDMKMTMAFLLVKTPNTPIKNKMTLKIKT